MSEQVLSQKHQSVLLVALLLKLGGKVEVTIEDLEAVKYYDGATITILPQKGVLLEVDRGGSLN